MGKKSDHQTTTPTHTPLLDPYVPLREAVQLLNVTEEAARVLGDSGAIECVRDVNNERRFSRDSIARYLFMKRQTEASKINKRARELTTEAIQKGRRGRVKP